MFSNATTVRFSHRRMKELTCHIQQQVLWCVTILLLCFSLLLQICYTYNTYYLYCTVVKSRYKLIKFRAFDLCVVAIDLTKCHPFWNFLISFACIVVSSDGMSFMGLIGRQQTAILSQKLKYLSNPAEEFSTKSVTVWLVMDITSDEGRKLILNAFEHVEQSSEMRLALIPNVPSSSDPIVAQTVLAVLDTYSESKALRFLKAFLSDGHDAQKARKSKESMLEFAKSTKVETIFHIIRQ